MTSDSSPSAEGTSGSGGGGGGNSYSQRNCLPSPWAQVVRGGGEPDPVAPRSPSASPSSVLPEPNHSVSDQLPVPEPQTAAVVETHPEVTEGSNNGNASGVKKSAWNKPSPNGVVEGSTTPVMGAASWPALSELTKAIPKSLSFSSESSSKPTSDGSVAISQAPVIPQQAQRPVRPNANHHQNQNHNQPVRQRSMKRGGGAGGGYNRPTPPPPPPQPPTPPPMPRFPVYDLPYRGFVPAVLDTSVRDQSPYNNNNNNFAQRPVGHPNVMSDHSGSRRRNNFGPRPRGDGGPYLNNNGRRDHHEREWRGPQPPMAPPPPPPPRGFMQQGHLGPAPFIAPQPLRPPYGTPMGYDMTPPPFLYVPSLPSEPYRGAPPILPRAPPPPMFIPIVDTPKPVKILTQVEYYFSEANLKTDGYLKSIMDDEGWVPISLVAGFHRLSKVTNDIQLILSSLRDSTVVEIQGETIRSRKDWQKYVRSANNGPVQDPPANGPLPEASLNPTSSADTTTPGETSGPTTGSPKQTKDDDVESS